MRRDDLNRRRDQIIQLLCENEALSAADLAERLDVSVQTIRTDLRDLDNAALVQRRGGMVRLRQQSENIGYSPRSSVSRGEKQSIALAVKNLVPDGARVALGTGTTVEACARLLATREKLFVATNNLHAAFALQMAPDAVVELAGGTLRLRDLDVIGGDSTRFFAGFRVDQAIFSCGGISATGEVLDYNRDEVAARTAIAGCAHQKILVVDSTKFNHDLPCRHGQLWDYDYVIVGGVLAEELATQCAKSGCTVISVG
ncbi:DeoR family transcriptional regulator [Epibacterium sp. SM1979]|uniref:DeoR family transcriptional regulator n=1 Tax=Tritonibacter litoralis TaxID=2662264 RepID=A0A843YJG9_9RHOB|nr:DeoR/GlpR family DNA-binding transcription regulator [Tritonibacter litoralis]MQQ09309.1 DeoR family transcriptional regulator [Tritonibacter litoralis]